ncbi:F-box protein At3g07870-like [Nicotiana tabacum]|uniref:F-box protein At3g07870-like n=1 Tax=Nicotiana tabacum TaxID=4097 RepID=UPI003F4E8691
MTNLPSSILEDIFLRLSPKTIFICQSVCKSWLNLISHPEFIKLHLSKSHTNLIIYNINHSRSSLFNFVNLENKPNYHRLTFEPNFHLDIKTNFPNINFNPVGSIHGLVCLYYKPLDNNVLDIVYIFNPTTRQYIELPEPKGLRNCPNLVTYGFGFDPMRMEYKVIRIYQVETHNINKEKYYTSEVQVYTLGTRFWRSVGYIKLRFERRYSGVYFNGKLHWLVKDVEENESICFIDMHDELDEWTLDTDEELNREKDMTFSTAPGFNKRKRQNLPTPRDRNYPDYRSLGVLGNYLCLCDNNTKSYLDIWVMKEYGVKSSWTKEIVIDITPECNWFCHTMVHVLKVFRDGEILFQLGEDVLFTYNPEKKTLTKNEYFSDRFWASTHVSSLLSLKNFGTGVVNNF